MHFGVLSFFISGDGGGRGMFRPWAFELHGQGGHSSIVDGASFWRSGTDDARQCRRWRDIRTALAAGPPPSTCHRLVPLHRVGHGMSLASSGSSRIPRAVAVSTAPEDPNLEEHFDASDDVWAAGASSTVSLGAGSGRESQRWSRRGARMHARVPQRLLAK